MELDPLKQDIWFTPMMSIIGHLWRAGSETSVCGLPWKLTSMAWTASTERPKEHCEKCNAVSEGSSHEG